MRGKVLPYRRTVLAVGITPAYAGKRLPSLLFLALHWDHPRVCGEKTLLFLKWCSDTGSPPRMRGKEDTGAPGKNWPGITPAYAGKRLPRLLFLALHRDHPRVCGEKSQLAFAPSSVSGSPPRMRGKAGSLSGSMVSRRITPAYAGKSLQLGRLPSQRKDHPRVCGEKRFQPDNMPLM